MKKILFVCLGNICRSPAAEAVYKDYLEKNGESQNIFVDSAGTSSFHEGNPADSRMREFAMKRGLEITSLSRGVRRDDFEEFDLIITMDNSNLNIMNNKAIGDAQKNKLLPFCDFLETRRESEVPDPYYGGDEGFENVLDILEDGMKRLHERVKQIK